MILKDLAKSYIKKAKVRLEMLEFLYKKEAYSDVIREAQETVELATKAMLRHRGIEPPKLISKNFQKVKKRKRAFILWRHRFYSHRGIHSGRCTLSHRGC
ncbi:MAG: HEPN domain-containing protein [Thermodesulfovibrio sp.]|nr:HEPN domain-containing protein [Thermodesulfovibrio sp.]